MDQRSFLPGAAAPEPPNRSAGSGDSARNPFSLRAQAFSSPVTMVFGLAVLAVLACAIALGGLLLLAGDGRRADRPVAASQVAALPALPRAWSEPPVPELRAMTVAPIVEPAPAAAAIESRATEPQDAAPREAFAALGGPAEIAPLEEAPAEGVPVEGVPVEGVPLPPRRDMTGATPFTGVWAPDPAACSPRQNRRGYLPAVIGADGAWAGETSCTFENGQQTGTTWRFSAVCSNARRKWKADVRLTVTGDRLVWASQRGSQAYVRCARTARET
jgi:hypothetical protein